MFPDTDFPDLWKYDRFILQADVSVYTNSAVGITVMFSGLVFWITKLLISEEVLKGRIQMPERLLKDNAIHVPKERVFFLE